MNPTLPEPLANLPPDELASQLWAILEAVDFEYERFCDALGLDPSNGFVERFHADVHSSWPEAWRRFGDTFWEAQRPLVAKWQVLLS